MADPSTAHALLIGIEQYSDGVNPLDGPAKDVYRFAKWLLDCKVPRDHISVLLSPLEGNQKIAQDIAALLGKTSLPAATRTDVDQAFEQLKRTQASFFFMLWGGHGWETSQGARRLFYADATRQSYKNLDLTQQLTAMRSTLYQGISEQVIIVDACANSFKLKEGELPHDQPALGDPLPNLRQLVMFAASSGEYAENKGIEKGGLFSAEVLKELNSSPVEVWPPDMEIVMSRVKRKFVNLREEGKVEQTPFFEVYRSFSGGEQTFGKIQPASQITKSINPLKPEQKLDSKLMARELIISRLVIDQENELKYYLSFIHAFVEPERATTYYESLSSQGYSVSFPSPLYNPKAFISSILSASRKQEKLFPDFLKLLKEDARDQKSFDSFLRLKDSLVCLQELEYELKSLQETKICIKGNEYNTYSVVESCLTDIYIKESATESGSKKLEFMEMLNKLGVTSPSENTQPLITFIKEIEWIFSEIKKSELKKRIWTITSRFLTLKHEIEGEAIQPYIEQFDQKRRSEASQNTESKYLKDSVLFSIRRKLTSKPSRYHVTAHKWDGNFSPPVELRNELKRNELEKCITSHLSELAQKKQISTSAIIEFFLPDELLDLSIDQWKIEEEVGTPQILGILFCVILRCQKRLTIDSGENNSRIQERVKERWECLCSSFDERREKKIEWVDPNSTELTELVTEEYNCTGFTAVINKENIKRLKPLSASAIPIVIWTRKQVSLPADSDLCSFFEKNLKIGTMSNVDELMQAVLKLRRAINSGEIRKNVSLFWDDPSRYIPQSNAQSP